MKNFENFPFHFFILIKSNNPEERKQTEALYYKLNEILRKEEIDLKLKLIKMEDLKENKLDLLSKISGIEKEKFSDLDFFITNDTCEIIFFSEDIPLGPKEKFQKILNFLKGFKKISNKEDLGNFLSNANEESISLLIKIEKTYQ